MSLFGSRKKTTVGTSVARVIEDNMLPDSIKAGMVAANLDRSDRAVEYVMDEMIGGMALKVDSMYRYGRDHYINGLPLGTTMSAITGREVVEQAVEADVGVVDSIVYYHLRPVNLLHVGWTALVSTYGYDSSTNKMLVEGTEVFLSDMVAVVTETNFAELESGTMDRWGTLPNAGPTPKKKLLTSSFQRLNPSPEFVVDASAPNDYLKVSYCWEVDEVKVIDGRSITLKVIKEGELSIPVTGFSLSANYFHVCYLKDGKAGYWMYELNSGLKPQVDAVFDVAPNAIGTFFPWAYFRFNKQSMNDNKSSPEFISIKKLLDKVSMNLEEVTDSMHENPDIADVEQAMMMLAVPANTENEMERRYAFDFFSKLYDSAVANTNTASSPAMARLKARFGDSPLVGNTITIQDKKFKMALSYTGIFRRRVAGSIGKVGAHDSGITSSTETVKYVDTSGTESSWTPAVGMHYYRRQVTENLYEEITIEALRMTYWIWGDYTDTAGENEDILLIPLDYEITQEYTLLEREKLYGRSMHYIFNSRVVTKLKWYQSGLFKAILMIVAIVIMIYNVQAGMAALSKAAALGATAGALAYMVLVAAIKYIAVTLLVRVFVKVVGVKIAFLAAIIAAVYGMYQIIDAGSVAGAPWGQELLSVSNNLTSAINRSVGKDMDALMTEAEAFEKEMDTKTKLLEETQRLLDQNVFLTPMIIWGETPDDFYQRTVHSGNIGIVGIDAVSSYVEMQLRLPKLSDSVGAFV